MRSSIIITTWNTITLLRACLYPTRSFSPVDSFETIVVANAAKDFSSDNVEKEFPRATLLKSAVNTGMAR